MSGNHQLLPGLVPFLQAVHHDARARLFGFTDRKTAGARGLCHAARVSQRRWVR